jgi:hypothetical protein
LLVALLIVKKGLRKKKKKGFNALMFIYANTVYYGIRVPEKGDTDGVERYVNSM